MVEIVRCNEADGCKHDCAARFTHARMDECTDAKNGTECPYSRTAKCVPLKVKIGENTYLIKAGMEVVEKAIRDKQQRPFFWDIQDAIKKSRKVKIARPKGGE